MTSFWLLATFEKKDIHSIVPIDEYLGIYKLHFKITIQAMLKIADYCQI
jgi:hypothetical protein